MTTPSEKETLPPNPYVGPRAFERSESKFFFGRDEEIEILTGLVMAHQASLLFAQSGAGKSSLLRAGLAPKVIRQRRVGYGEQARLYQQMAVLPILSVGKGIPPQIEQPINNIYIFSALLGLLPQADPGSLAGLSLAEGLALYAETRREAKETLRVSETLRVFPADTTLLIFDQFEELFTAYPDRWREREGFFQQVSSLLAQQPELHVLFSMREDYIAELTPYANLLPGKLRHRFRLERLQREAALLAITQPPNRANRTFAEGVAEALVDNLRQVKIGQKGRGAGEIRGGAALCHKLSWFIRP